MLHTDHMFVYKTSSNNCSSQMLLSNAADYKSISVIDLQVDYLSPTLVLPH